MIGASPEQPLTTDKETMHAWHSDRGVCAAAIFGILALTAPARFSGRRDERATRPTWEIYQGAGRLPLRVGARVKGMGDGSDKLVTIDVNPASSRYGKGDHKISVRGQGEAHHMGFTDDRRFL